MANILFLTGDQQTFGTASTTRYGNIVNGATLPGLAQAPTEANASIAAAVGGTLSGLVQTTLTNPRTSSTVFTVRVNAVDTAITITIPATTTGIFTDTSHSASVAQDDLLSYSTAMGTGAGNIVTHGAAILFVPTSGNATGLFTGGTTSGGGANLSGTGPITTYLSASGVLLGSSTIEADSQANVPYAGTSKYFQIFVSVNGRSTSTVFTERINAASGAQTVTFTAATTGFIKDTTNTDSFSAGDKFATQVALGTGTGTLTVTTSGCWLDAAATGNCVATGQRITGNSNAAGTTGYFTVGSRQTAAPNATESAVANQVGQSVTFSKFWASAITNLSTTDVSLKFRINAANGNQVVTLTALTAGAFQDTTHSDAVGPTDNIAYQISNITTAAIALSSVSWLMVLPDIWLWQQMTDGNLSRRFQMIRTGT